MHALIHEKHQKPPVADRVIRYHFQGGRVLHVEPKPTNNLVDMGINVIIDDVLYCEITHNML